MQNKIEIQKVSYTYNAGEKGAYEALKDISLEIREGEFVCLLGPSGCGKSTLLSLLMGCSFPTGGEILLDGKKLSGPGKDRAVVFQHYSLFPWLTARKNVLFALKRNGKPHSRQEQGEMADAFLKAVGLLEARHKFPCELSGGMQQRVAIARALAMEADVLLMDEPFGAIDPRIRGELQVLVKTLSKENGKTVVFVTHDIDEAIQVADRVVLMEPGRIREILPIRLTERGDKGSAAYQQLYEKLLGSYYEEGTQRLSELANLDSETARKLKAARDANREEEQTVGEAAFI